MNGLPVSRLASSELKGQLEETRKASKVKGIKCFIINLLLILGL